MSRQPSRPYSQESIASSSQPDHSQPLGPGGFRVPAMPSFDSTNRGEVIGSFGRFPSQHPPTGSPFVGGSVEGAYAAYGNHWGRAGSVSQGLPTSTPFTERESSVSSMFSSQRSIREYSMASVATTSTTLARGLSSTTPAATTPPPPMFRWDDHLDGVMIRVLTENAARGRKSDNSFKAAVFAEVCDAINDQPVLRPVDNKMVQSRLAYLKSDRYIPLRDLRNLSGIGWDELRQRVVASDEFWEGLKRNESAANRKLLTWRNRSWVHYDAFHALYHGATPDGRHVITPQRPDRERNESEGERERKRRRSGEEDDDSDRGTTEPPSSAERRQRRTSKSTSSVQRQVERDATIERQLATLTSAASAIEPKTDEAYRVVKTISDDAGWSQDDYKRLINFFADNY
ncbi:hypothetical protein HD553DRAFT_342270 [Filobasidium floriforme]|uniref:uncharacterized protein n=1 Tax=Filobasidium floriforme TaxID=5210 RepID=UPI001E8E9229|nr:uncharacterized protein HD553DRAFT_342270 [Filobasidium floriforme]KAH8084760.1 hypothetical protein HD553DRAFT_342270 [Filobasidium floriforme]